MSTNAPRHRSVRVRGLRLHYIEWGEAQPPTLLLLHGFASSTWTSWRELGDRLSGAFHVVGLDLRGHGDSDWDPAARYTLRDYAEDIEAFVSTLDCPPRTVIGHSMGGRLALRYAARHQDSVQRLVLIDSKVRGGRATPDMIATYPPRFGSAAEAEAFAQRLYGRRRTLFEDEFVHHPDGTVDWRFDLSGQRRSRAGPDPLLEQGQWAELTAVRVPTLVFRSGRSGTIPPGDPDLLAELNPAVRFVEFPSAGHLLHQDEPDRFWSELTAFLTGADR